MPRKPDPSLKNKSGIYQSQIAQSRKYEEKNDKIILRIPLGAKAILAEYVKEKASADPTNPKYSVYNGKAYRPSVGALIRSLLEEETGIDLSRLNNSE